MIKRIFISSLIILILFSYFFYCFSFVSFADPLTFDFPDSFFSDSSSSTQYDSFLDDLKDNSSFKSIDDYVCVSMYYSGSTVSVFILRPTAQFNAVGATGICFVGDYASFSVDSSLLSSYEFSLTPFSSTGSVRGIFYGYNKYHVFSGQFAGSSLIVSSFSEYPAFYYLDASSPFSPDYGLTGVVVGFDFSVEAFTQWLIDTGKYAELPAYIGTGKLKSFVQFYHDWGSSNSIFVIRLVEWFMHFNLASQTIENRNIIKSTIDRLYQEYKNSAFVQINHDSSILPHHRKNIETNTTDDDLTLVTDDPNDDTLISILRDILRGVISIPNSIYDNTQVILAKLDQLNYNIIISNNGGASSGTDLNPVLDKMDDIIDALGSDTVSVEIDQTTKDDTDDFFDDWNFQFSTALNNKFPVASQLRTFFTGFFERCGIDADSDGEVYQYYNPGVLTASSVSRSAGTATEDDIVTEFLGKFDNSDPAFLDDASYHGVPDLSVSVGGQSVSLIDFRVYAKYREKIHFIISFVIWTLYLLHLYKALPQIIGQVADVAVKTSDL